MTLPESRVALRNAIEEVRIQYPFAVDAWVLLPDHLHCLWQLPVGDKDYSKRWGLIKSRFTKRTKHLFQRDEWMSDSKRRHHEGTLWQRRFWEHQIKDEADYRAHMDYIHFNPVKHGLVDSVIEWPYSTFHRYMRNGVYEPNWGGGGCEVSGEFGEAIDG